jgi:tetrahydromethanopterin S-methyltransferase subunit D
MAKGSGKGGSTTSTMNNGGIMGSGIFGMFGTTVQCKSDDTSAFCMLSKTVNVIIMIGFLLLVLYFIYLAFKYFFGNRTQAPQQMTGGYIPRSKSRSRRVRSKSYR